jgi:glycosyltransferase involved in cell wall biosynthesis
VQIYGSHLTLIFSGGGFGGAGARNIGLEQIGDTDFVFFLDDDDEWLPDKISSQIALMSEFTSSIGVTCWNFSVGATTRLVKRNAENSLIQNLSVWNTVGSFSFFGYRWTNETKNLRLWPELAASQDWEFYLRLAEFGSIAVVEQALVNYHAHSGPKISGKPDVKQRALERYLQRARIYMIKAEQNGNFLSKCANVVCACFLALLGMNIPYSRTVVGRSFASIFR